MPHDDSWEKFTKDVKPLKQGKVAIEKPKPAPVPLLTEIDEGSVHKGESLGERLYRAMILKQVRNLVSHVYKNLGIGAPPISGGKIEGKKRTKR